MRITKIKSVVIMLVFIIASCKAQKTNDSITSPFETWYYYNSSNELGSCVITDQYLIFDSNIEQKENSNKDTVAVREILSKKRIIAYNENKKKPFAAIQLDMAKKGEMLTLVPLVEGLSVEEVKRKLSADSIPSWKDLTGRLMLSAKKFDALKQAPGLDRISREDMITSLQWREVLSKKLQAFVTEMKGERQYMVYRFVREFQKQKLLELGYNPFKQVDFNWEEQFKDDPEVLKLLTEPISFD